MIPAGLVFRRIAAAKSDNEWRRTGLFQSYGIFVYPVR
jgi:hypothetical protein